MAKRKAARKKLTSTKYGVSAEAAHMMDVAYDGALAVIARSKARGDWHPSPFDAPKPRAQRAPSTRKAAARAKALEAKVAGGSTGRGAVGPLCEKLLLEGQSTAQIIAAVKAAFPGAKTTPASIASYKSRMRSEGRLTK